MMNNVNPHWALALSLRARAYAPYSDYHVGCVLVSASGQTYTGVNVENPSFGATICAERHAVGAMLAAGESVIAEVIVASEDGGTPCGMCCQVLSEFATPETPVTCLNAAGEGTTCEFKHFWPNSFQSSHVKRIQ